MAIYEYRCQACGNQFELMRSIKDDSLPLCTVCGAAQVEKLISHSSFILKGKGWYSTDYGTGGSSKPASSSSSSAHASGCGCCSSAGTCAAAATAPATDTCAGGSCAAPAGGAND
jgi:putative FmdB family regulatory protein